jgi:hypothetical protein
VARTGNNDPFQTWQSLPPRSPFFTVFIALRANVIEVKALDRMTTDFECTLP